MLLKDRMYLNIWVAKKGTEEIKYLFERQEGYIKKYLGEKWEMNIHSWWKTLEKWSEGKPSRRKNLERMKRKNVKSCGNRVSFKWLLGVYLMNMQAAGNKSLL